jgi:hypothetical protein
MTFTNGTEGLVAYLTDANTESETARKIIDNLSYYQNIDPGEKTEALAGAIYDWFIRECVSRDQYLEIPEAAYREIFALYRNLVARLRSLANDDTSEGAVTRVVREHRLALISVIRGISGTPRAKGSILPCAEYTAEFQLAILRIEPTRTLGPFLDIGCGEGAALVATMRASGVDAMGIDQYCGSPDGSVLRANWLEFSYRADYWGTIVSHMAFSNHFSRALTTDPELAALYRSVYLEILDSLKPGGSFRYAPALRREEAALDRARFSVERMGNIPGEGDLDTVIVTRLR